jgi:hypothetical protein
VKKYVFCNRHALDSVTLKLVSIPVFWFDPTNRHYLLTYLLHGAESFLRSWPVFATSQEISRIFMEPEGSLPYHKCPPPVPILSQLHPVPSPLPTFWRSILILFSHLCLGFRNGIFPSGFPTSFIFIHMLSWGQNIGWGGDVVPTDRVLPHPKKEEKQE